MSDKDCPATNNRGEPCGLAAGWGVEGVKTGSEDAGPCKFHGGAGGAPEGNKNAVGNEGGDGAEPTHGVYADANKMYNQEFSDILREVTDKEFEDLYNRYTELHGEPGFSDKSHLFEIAVNTSKRIYADNWSVDKPDALKTANPLVDRETEPVPIGDGETVTQVTYSESVPIATQQRYRREDRQWLKSKGLLENDPDARQANALEEGFELSLSDDDRSALENAFGSGT